MMGQPFLRLLFSIGPVQGFVGESRRTRDLWASSFLLSYLCGHAMAGVLEGPTPKPEGWHSEIVLPNVEDNLLLIAIQNVLEHGELNSDIEPPNIGTLPNRFIARCSHPMKAAQTATNHLNRAWAKIGDAVWEAFIQPVQEHGHGTQAIWKRQCERFWDVQWVVEGFEEHVGEEPSNLLDRRKNWRTYAPQPEPGSKCSLMEGWQELSGYSRSIGRQRPKQEAFWNAVRRHNKVDALDLRANERLCALATIKRLFPKVSKQALYWTCATSSWPSTAYMAVVPWLIKGMEEDREAIQNYANIIRSKAGLEKWKSLRSEVNTNIQGLQAYKAPESPIHLTGTVYLEWGLEQLASEGSGPNSSQAQEVSPLNDLKQELLKLLEHLEQRGVPRAKPFYGLLLMDGDSMGNLLRELGGSQVPKALSLFANRVGGCVESNNGVLIYAGGDDVLAMVPVDKAITCANALAHVYDQAFEETLGDNYDAWKEHTTISAAVVFAHTKTPLRTVLSEAHRLLDDEAKAGNGRASLAVEVYKSSGRTCQWVTTWTGLRNVPEWDGQRHGEHIIDALRFQIANAKLSNSLIYRLRDDIGVLCGWPRWEPGLYGEFGWVEPTSPARGTEGKPAEASSQEEHADQESPTEAQRQEAVTKAQRWVAAAIHHCWTGEQGTLEQRRERRREADQTARVLLQASRRVWRRSELVGERNPGEPPTRIEEIVEPCTFGMDAVVLARFIHQGGWGES